MKGDDYIKKYVSEIDYPSRRGRSFGRWKDRIKEYMCEWGASRGRGLEQKSALIGSSGGFTTVAIPLVDISVVSKVSETDR